MPPIKATKVIIWCILFVAAGGIGCNNDHNGGGHTTPVSGTLLGANGG